MIITVRKMTGQEEAMVNSQIKAAEAKANEEIPFGDNPEKRNAWTQVFMDEMNRLTIALGLRVDLMATSEPSTVSEQPLVGLNEIAEYLKVTQPTARKMLAEINAPFIQAYMPRLAIFPSILYQVLKSAKTIVKPISEDSQTI